eukprot:4632263-Pyramimonas_sp.AAC.1
MPGRAAEGVDVKGYTVRMLREKASPGRPPCGWRSRRRGARSSRAAGYGVDVKGYTVRMLREEASPGRPPCGWRSRRRGARSSRAAGSAGRPGWR